MENGSLLVGFAEALAVSTNEHFGTLNLDFEGRTYDFLAANIAIQARSALGGFGRLEA
jgi:hypothetical protein